jgi:hypothetical protein
MISPAGCRRGCRNGTFADHPAYPFPHSTDRHSSITMNIHLSLAPLVSLVAGILILVMPKLLNYIIAIYLIVIGVIGLI